MKRTPSLDDYRHNGFVVLKGAISTDEAQAMALFMRRYAASVEASYPEKSDALSKWYLAHRPDNGVLYDVYQRIPETRRFCEDSHILDFVEAYFGRSFYLYVNSYLYKPAQKMNEVPWHQDFLNRPCESEKVLAWISLDHATRRNGCLKVIPGSHKSGFRDWYRVAGATHHDRIKLEAEEEAQAVHVETEPGDVVLFSNYLIHSSEQNHSDGERGALRFVYKKLDSTELPRGSALMMRAKAVDLLRSNEETDSSSLLRRVGRRLLRR